MGEEMKAPETEAIVRESVEEAAADPAQAAAEAAEAVREASEEARQTAAEASEEARQAAAEASEEARQAAAEASEEARQAAAEASEEARQAAAGTSEQAVQAAAGTAEAAVQTAGEKAQEPAESMADYEAEIDASLRRYERGEKVKCTVVSVDMDKIMVELGSTTGIIRKQDVNDDPAYNLQENIKAGDEVEASVVRPDDGHGNVVLSMKAASAQKAWDRLLSLLESKATVTVKINGVTKAGVTTILEGVRGFIPASKLSLGFVSDEELNDWVGRSVEARVITAEKDGRKLVLSSKEILREKEAAERREAAAAVKAGSVVEGTVETIKDYGAFVNLGKGVTGLLHVSQISPKRIKTPGEVLKEGEKVTVKVTKIDGNRISLSIKALEENAEEAPKEREEKITFKLPKSEAIGTGLGDLLKGIKL